MATLICENLRTGKMTIADGMSIQQTIKFLKLLPARLVDHREQLALANADYKSEWIARHDRRLIKLAEVMKATSDQLAQIAMEAP